MGKKVKAKVLAVDDHYLILESISKIVNRMSDATVTNVATPGRMALELIGRHSYGVRILDASMPDTSSFDLIAKTREQSESTRIIVYIMHEEIWIINRLDIVQNFV